MALADLVVVMNHGRIEQAGTPREVFNAPRTEFVARFIGGHNVIARRRRPDRRARRPAQARAARRRGRGTTPLPATVRDVEYQGTLRAGRRSPRERRDAS